MDKNLEENAKKYSGKVVVGLELADDYSQVSYCTIGSGEPQTISLITGSEEYNIPTIVGKLHDNGAWIFGKDAMKAARDGDGFLIKDLIFLAQERMPVVIEDMEYNIAEILAMFIKKCLFMIPEVTSVEKLESVVITLKELPAKLLVTLEQTVKSLNLVKTQFYFTTHQESFFQYVLHQDKNLWMQDVALFDYREEGCRAYLMKMNHRTVPVVTFIENYDFPGMRLVDWEKVKEKELEEQRLDQDFLEIARQICDKKQISTIYLLGDGFNANWFKESLKYVCHNRRAFQGNNLYSKGACYLAMEKVTPSMLMQSYVYLAEDKLIANLGMRVMRDGKECYMTLLDAGESWFEASKSCDLILENDNKLPIIVTPMDGKNVKVAEIVLEGLHLHNKRTNRIHIDVNMKSIKTVSVTVSDMGFGEIYPSSGQVWREEFDIN